jgi:hypothetical protein
MEGAACVVEAAKIRFAKSILRFNSGIPALTGGEFASDVA